MMTVQTVPYALQNASHSAALFRQSASAPFLAGGALSSLELLVAQQASPNMSVLLGAGRAKVPGTSVSPPAGQSWTTQAMYDCLNDAPLTLTIAASNPTNPRIDLVYIQVQDSFYSGATNQAIAGVVTGTPAPSPSVPATPANAVAIATIAVGAGVTSIVSANIARVVTSAVLIGGLYPTLTATTLAALQTAATLPAPSRVAVLANGSEWYWNGTTMVLDNVPRVSSSAARDALYVAPVAVVNGDTVYRTDVKMSQTYDGTRWRYTTSGLVPVIPTSVVGGTLAAGGAITFSTTTALSINGCFTGEFDNYKLVFELDSTSAGSPISEVLRIGGVNATAANYVYQTLSGIATATAAAGSGSVASWFPQDRGSIIAGVYTTELFSPARAVQTFMGGTSVFQFTTTTAGDVHFAGFHTLATAYDGIAYAPTSGTMTGRLRIYGWNNN